MWIRVTRAEAEALNRCLSIDALTPADRTAITAIVRRWDEARTQTKDHTNAIHVARKKYANPSSDDIEIDIDAPFSIADNGLWIGGWFWLTNEEALS